MCSNTCLHSISFNALQVHAYIISSLKKEMPSMFGKDNKKKELVNNLGEIYARIEREHQISPGDFPNLRKMQVSSGVLAGAPNIQGKSIRVTAGNMTEATQTLMLLVGKACCNVEMGLEICAGYIWA